MTLHAAYPPPMRPAAVTYWPRKMAGVYWHQVCAAGHPRGSTVPLGLPGVAVVVVKTAVKVWLTTELFLMP